MAEYIHISKIDAAKRQIEIAIRLFLGSEDVVSIHTLAAAAHTILKDLSNKQGKESIVKDILSKDVKPEMRDKMRHMLNDDENFFKHADRDHNGLLEFYTEKTEFFIWDACLMYTQLTKEVSPLISVFNLWFYSKHPGSLVDRNLVANLEKQVHDLGVDYRNRAQFLALLPHITTIKGI